MSAEIDCESVDMTPLEIVPISALIAFGTHPDRARLATGTLDEADFGEGGGDFWKDAAECAGEVANEWYERAVNAELEVARLRQAIETVTKMVCLEWRAKKVLTEALEASRKEGEGE